MAGRLNLMTRLRAGARAFMADASLAGGGSRGAVWSRRSRWGASGPNAVQDYDLTKQRTNSRSEIRKNGLADTAVESLVTNIVGAGIKPQFATGDAECDKALSQSFLVWTDESDADGGLDFYGQQALAARSMIEGGDCFGRLRARQLSDMETIPLQVQILEAEFCPESNNRAGVAATETAPAVNPIRAGVEFNLIGKRVAYHLTREHPFDGIILGSVTNYDTVPVPASEVVHLRCLRRPGQVRGEPWLTRALAKLANLDQYDVGQLERQKVAALFAGFIYDEEEDAEGDEDEMFPGQVEGDEDGLDLAPLEPGTMQKLRRGERISWSTPPSPGDSYVDFMREQKRGVAQAVGALYEQISGDWTQVNDRTFRAAVNEYRRRCSMWQHNLLVYQFCRPVLRRWVELGVLSGRIRLPANVTIARAARAKWVPEGWAYINPTQDIEAKKAEVRAGFRSRTEVVSAAGYDAAQVDAEQAADAARADKLGLVHDTDPRKTSNAGGAQADKTAADDAGPGDGPPQRD